MCLRVTIYPKTDTVADADIDTCLRFHANREIPLARERNISATQKK